MNLLKGVPYPAEAYGKKQGDWQEAHEGPELAPVREAQQAAHGEQEHHNYFPARGAPSEKMASLIGKAGGEHCADMFIKASSPASH